MSSDDIVTRLRNADCIGEDTTVLKVFTEAADEIKRLRAELKRWQTCEMVTESICGWDSEKTYCDACKAVRGE